MSIRTIKPRRDGKFLVTLVFDRDLKNLHKVFTREQIEKLVLELDETDSAKWLSYIDGRRAL